MYARDIHINIRLFTHIIQNKYTFHTFDIEFVPVTRNN